ncbi:TetR/AcrR family transcriptional regulator [Motilimonas sp. 1_MG-2023]|uniref:TetR/AcrR family transcriptional regulator n=1 Tax=Motilimonas sp. 1_MG-2023 TaxID=3062672 RepID=UPI0026E1680C|nr:TetR/AcrR family transcriptional regulator [Motilimonas sp. 1_MG-2023]MDO6525223.1 TetR/AcrR family transcriptional regulator [Motilimonas sp. 1_MG-2023]
MNSVGKNSQLDWLNFALDVLVSKGPEQLKIIPLCELKGVTKGSFYHHFKNRAAFIDSLMEHWYNTMTIAFIEQANSQVDALQRLLALDKVIASSNIEAENHIRAWALKEPSIARHLEKIDSQRQTYLAQCYIELGLEPRHAKDVALMAYSSFLGMQRIHPAPSKEEILRVSAMALKTFIPNLDI